MKKYLLFFVSCFILFFSIKTIANAEIYEDFKYEVNDDNTITITSYDGYEKKVIVPETIDNKNVTTIKGFGYTGSVVEVVLPDTVKRVESGFLGCNKLEKITMPKHIEYIGGLAFGYWPVKDGDEYRMISDFTVYGYDNSAAELFADFYDVRYISLGTSDMGISAVANIKYRVTDRFITNKDELRANIVLEWMPVKNANSYEVLLYNSKTKKYESIDNYYLEDVTSFEYTVDTNKTYKFKIRPHLDNASHGEIGFAGSPSKAVSINVKYNILGLNSVIYGTLFKGSSYSFVPTNILKKVNVEISNPKIVTYDKKTGKLIAKNLGNATISINKIGSKNKETYNVQVFDNKIHILNKQELSNIDIGEIKYILTENTPYLSFKSSNNSIIEIDRDEIRGKKAGTATITINRNNISTKLKIKVNNKKYIKKDITLDKAVKYVDNELKKYGLMSIDEYKKNSLSKTEYKTSVSINGITHGCLYRDYRLTLYDVKYIISNHYNDKAFYVTKSNNDYVRVYYIKN